MTRGQGIATETVRAQSNVQVRTSLLPPLLLPLIPADIPCSVRESGSHRTPAELVREKRLRDDPMAEVHGPLFVTCRRCGRRIKLSPKSAYDPFHWTKHRERCLNKSLGKARATSAVRRTPKSPVSRPSSRGEPCVHTSSSSLFVLRLVSTSFAQKVSLLLDH